MNPLPVGLANFYIFQCHPTQNKDTLWTSGSHILEIIIEKVCLKLFEAVPARWGERVRKGGI